MRKREEINLKKKKGIKNPEKNPCRESREWRSQTKNKKKKGKIPRISNPISCVEGILQHVQIKAMRDWV